MISEIQALRVQAEEALASARHSLGGGFLTTAINRAYYAAFHMARAALLTVGEAPKTHLGVRVRFNFHFAKTGRLPGPLVKTLTYAEELREGADYDVSPVFEEAAVADLIADVARFVEAVEPLLALGKHDA